MKQTRLTTKTALAVVGLILVVLGVSNVFLVSKRSVTTNQKCTENEPNLHTKREVELAIGIVTVARQNNEDYLLQTLHGIQRELNNFGADLVKSIFVVHPRTEDTPHAIFEQAKTKFSTDNRFEFVSHDAKDETLTETNGLIRKMRPSDRQQNLDAAQLFDTIHTRFCSKKPNGYFLLMEDDFDLCPNSFVHYQRILFAAEYLFFPNFTAVRTSYGFSGLIFHCHDLPFNRDMFRAENANLPPDTLVGYSFSRRVHSATTYYKDRQYAVYRHNLMNHIGHSSTLDALQHVARVFPGCFDSLHYRGIIEDCHLCFDEHEMCELKEFSPCTHPDMKGSIMSARASAEHDPQFMMNDPSVDEIKILTGEFGQDCNQVCNEKGLYCAKYMLPLVNKCSILKRKLKCDVCIDHNLRFDPSNRNPGYSTVEKYCYVSKILDQLKCEGGKDYFKRICPCANHHENKEEKEFTPDVLKEIMPSIPNLEQDFEMLQETIVLANLTTCERKAAFLSQVATETADLNHFNQEHHIEMFKDRKDLGNVNPGDELRYRGRGLLQIVGRKKYEQVSQALGVDFLGSPELLADRKYMPVVSAYFWTEFGMNKIADDTHIPGTIIAITHKLLAYKGQVNFQYHNRKAKWELSKQALGCAH